MNNNTINYRKALEKCVEMMNIYGKDNIYIVYYTMTDYRILYEIVADNTNLLSKMTIDFDESNVKFLING